MVTDSRVEALRDRRGAKKGIRSRFENNGHPDRGSDSATVDPNSPTFDPTVDTVSTEDVLTAAASVSVPAATKVPEPGYFTLLSSGLLAVLRRRDGRECQPIKVVVNP